MVKRFGAPLFIVGLSLAACTSDPKSATQAKSSSPAASPMTASMGEMAAILSRLMPKLTDQSVAANPQTQSEILELSTRLKGQAHGIDDTTAKTNMDPALRYVSRNFNNEINSSIALMQSGDWTKGQRQMARVTRNCIACHTMKSSASKDFMLTPTLTGFSEIEKGDYFASIRNFDQAIIHYETQLADSKWAQSHKEQWNDAFQKLLAVTIRVYNNPSLTMELISRFQDVKSYPASQKEMTQVWRQHTKEWRTEAVGATNPKSKALELYARASGLPKKITQPRGPAATPSRQNLVLLLRASGMMHEYLNDKTHATDQEALYLAGLIAEGLTLTNFWTYPEDYYLACISADKNSPWAKKCAEKFSRITATN